MKYKLVVLFGIFAALIVLSVVLVGKFGQKPLSNAQTQNNTIQGSLALDNQAPDNQTPDNQNEEQTSESGAVEEKVENITLVTSFYPMYILALNLTENLPNISVRNLTNTTIGCLHDYQLTTADMRTLTDSSVLLINGGGMEPFLEDIIRNIPSLFVMNATEHMELLSTEAHEHSHEEDEDTTSLHMENDREQEEEHHEEEDTVSLHMENDKEQEEEHHEEHDHGTANGHVWMSIQRYIAQVEQVARMLSEYDPNHRDDYIQNAKNYIAKLDMLKKEYQTLKEDWHEVEVVTLHAAFAYLTEELGIHVVSSADMDSETTLGAGQIGTMLTEMQLHQVEYIFAEEQYSSKTAEQLARESGAEVCILNTNLSGADDPDSYLNAMRENLQMLRTMIQK